MTITRAGRILTAIYYRLIEHGFEHEGAITICVNIDPEIIRRRKEPIIETLVADLVNAYKELEAKCGTTEAFDLLLSSLEAHYDEDAPVY